MDVFLPTPLLTLSSCHSSSRFIHKWHDTLYLSEWLKWKIVVTPNAGQSAEKLHHPCIAGGMWNGIVILEHSLTVKKKKTKLNFELPYDPAVILGIYPRERKIHAHTKICMWMSIAALFGIAKSWNQPGGLQHSWMVIWTVVNAYHGILLSKKSSKLLINVVTWMTL